jgi:hypothetical protein
MAMYYCGERRCGKKKHFFINVISVGFFCVMLIVIAHRSKLSLNDMVDMTNVDQNICPKSQYAINKNFINKPVIYKLTKCFLQMEATEKLDVVWRDLEKWKLGLKIWIGKAPDFVQKTVWKNMSDLWYISEKRLSYNLGMELIGLGDEIDLEKPIALDIFCDEVHSSRKNSVSEEILKFCKQ